MDSDQLDAALAASAGLLGDPLFSFSVPGRPIPWARAADGAEAGKRHTPKRQRNFKKVVGDECRLAMLQSRSRIIERPAAVALGIRIYLDLPASWETHRDPGKRFEWQRGQQLSFCIDRPDLDNWAKLPMDAMNGLAYADDDQVVAFPHSGKWYDPDRPRLEVDVWRVDR